MVWDCFTASASARVESVQVKTFNKTYAYDLRQSQGQLFKRILTQNTKLHKHPRIAKTGWQVQKNHWQLQIYSLVDFQ